MSLPTVTGVAPRWERSLAELLGRSDRAALVRRCADVPELIGVAAAGLARVAVVSSDFRSLDRPAVEALLASGVAVVGVHPPGQEDAGRALRRWGVPVVLPADLGAAALDEAIATVVEVAAGTCPGEDRPRAEGSPVADRDEDLAPPGPARLDAVPDPVDEELRRLVEEAGGGDPPPLDDVPPSPGAEDPTRQEGQVIVVWGPGSPGRSTLAVNLAAELAGPLSRVVLIDADTVGASLAQALAVLDEAPGLAAAARVADQDGLDERGLLRLAPEVRPGLLLLSGLPRADRWPEIRDSALADVIEVARRHAAHVVVDVAAGAEQDEELAFDTQAPRRHGATLTALESADRVVVVGAGDPIGLQRLVRALDTLTTLTAAPREVVVTRVRPGPVGPDPQRRIREALDRFAGVRSVHLVPEDRESLDLALLHGRALVEVCPTGAARTSIRALAERIAGREPTPGRGGTRWWRRRLRA